MQLLKRRRFSDNFNDTFSFVKLYGKHFFKNYFILNGLPLIFMLVVLYFFTTTFMGLSTFQNGDTGKIIEDYIANNSTLFIVITLSSVVVFFIFAIIQYTFVPIYMILYQRNNGINFTSKDIFNVMFKEKIGKILIFMFASFLLLIPTIIVGGILGLLLLITIFGIIFLFAYISMFYNNAMFEYLETDKGIWECFGYSFAMLQVKFWDNVGAIGLFILLSTFVSGGISVVANMISMVFAANTANRSERETMMMLAMLVAFIISKTISIFVQTIIQLAQAMVYYSVKEEMENIVTVSEIDKIGLGE